MSSTVPAAHLTDNDSCSDNDRPTTRPAPITDGLTAVETDTNAKSCDMGMCSQGNAPIEHAQWKESLSIASEPKDSSIDSDSDSGIESALSSPTNITNQSPSDFEPIPTESFVPDLEANICSTSAPLSFTEDSHIIATEESKTLPVDNGTAAHPMQSYSACEEGEASAAKFGTISPPPSPSLTQVPHCEEGGQPMQSHSVCEEDKASAAEFGTVASPSPSLTQVPHCKDGGPNLSVEPIHSSLPLVEANYACRERDTPSPKPTKTVHFATPLVTEVIFFLTCASEESKPLTANAVPPATTKTVSFSTPLMAEATFSASEQNNVFLTSFETDNGVVHSTPRSPPSSNLATFSENVSLNDEHILEVGDASVALADSKNSDLPSLMEAGSSHPATLSAVASAVREESSHWAPGTVIAGTVDFSPLPYSHSCCASQWEAESGANAEVDSTGSVDECLPSLIDDDHEELERFNPSPCIAQFIDDPYLR